jgi:hypothetical protein
MYDILNLFYSFSNEIETVLSPMLLIIFVFSEVLMCLSAFGLADVSDNCGYITRINNLIFLSLPVTRNLNLISNYSPHILEYYGLRRAIFYLLTEDVIWNSYIQFGVFIK